MPTWPWSHRNGAVAVREAAPPGPVQASSGPSPELVALRDTLELLQERLAELEWLNDPEEQGWLPIGGEGSRFEVSRSFLASLIRRSRLMFLKNPLVRRGVRVYVLYVFGQGVTIRAKHPDVNAVVQAFLEDPQNQAELTSHQARTQKATALRTDGNLFFVLFVQKRTGAVKVGYLPVDEVQDIRCNPQNASEPWYYLRCWTEQPVDGQTGVAQQKRAYYPDWRYRPPGTRRATVDNIPVRWDEPVAHVKLGALPGMRFGVPATYAALDWALAYKAFLEDWASIVRSLQRFAWVAKTAGGAAGVAAIKTKLGTTLGSGNRAETNPPPLAGSVAIMAEGQELTPIPKTGATITADDGRQLKLMVAAAFDLPETFFGDVDTGNLATAKTLDRPTELAFRDEQTLWSDTYRDLLQFVIDRAATAPDGPLRGAEATDVFGQPMIQLAIDPSTGEPLDRTLEIGFPPILEHDLAETIDAIAMAATLDGQPPAGTLDLRTTTRLLLEALHVDQAEDLLEQLFPEPGADGTGDEGDGSAPLPADTQEARQQEAERIVVTPAQVAAAAAFWRDVLDGQPEAGLLDAEAATGG